MNDDTLHDLLRKADTPARVSIDRIQQLPERVFRRRMRRRALRASGALLVVLCAGISAVLLVERPTPTSQVATVRTARPVFDDMDLKLHAQTAELLTSIQEKRARTDRANQRTVTRGDVMLTMNQQRNRAAMTLLQNAERTASIPSRASLAAEEYRRAIELFPDTPAAAVAQQRLDNSKAKEAL